MTRFARAKGSKASNEKLPEKATSWGEMKQELLNKNNELAEKKEREVFLKRREDSYRAFLQEKQDEEDKKVCWADFPPSNNVSNNFNKKRSSNGLNVKNKNLGVSVKRGESSDTDDETFTNLKAQIDKVLDEQSAVENHQQSTQDTVDSGSGDGLLENKMLKCKAHDTTDSDEDAPPEETSIKQKPVETVVKKVKKPKKKLKLVIEKDSKAALQDVGKVEKKVIPPEQQLSDKSKRLIEKKKARYMKEREKKLLKRVERKAEKAKNANPVEDQSLEDNKTEDTVKSEDEKRIERNKRRRERKKLKRLSELADKKVEPEKLSEEALMKIQKKKEKHARQAEKKQKFKEAKALENSNNITVNGENNSNKDINKSPINNEVNKKPHKPVQNGDKRVFEEPINMQQSQKKSKFKDNKEHQRKKSKTETMFINGRTIEIDYIDGFPVKKEDADRLRKLRKEMISKGLPRSEIDVALKLERRRAEKAFAREKKNVCFKCRQSGHNLSECPELDRDQVAETAGTGICFKCGSTEHTHFECRVVKGMDYKFASCFICKEQGHIAKQCPDNQRGLYPKGGACKVCGDVTHLKKDCPKYQVQQAQLQSSLSIGTLDNGNPDDMGTNVSHQSLPQTPIATRPNKVIKF